MMTDHLMTENGTTFTGDVTATAGPMTVRTITDDGEFDRLEPAWNALLERSDATVFQTFEWLRTWWTYFGRGRRLLILAFDRNGETEGIAPLFHEKEKVLGIPVATRLQFIGAELSDYLSVIAARGSEDAVMAAFAQWLAGHRRTWDVFDLEDVPETSASFALLPGRLESAGLSVYRYQGNVCPRVSLPASEAEMMRQLGPSGAYNLKRKSKRLKANFRSDVRLIRRPEDPIGGAIDDFAVIHGGRWKSQGHPSAFDDPDHRAFHKEVCGKLAERGWLRIFFLDIDEEPAAVCFSFNFRSTIYMYQSNAHGGEEVMKCSPGLLVRSTAIVEGIAEGMRVFDFMRGNEPYKYREWGAYDVNNWLIRSSSHTGAGRIRFYLFLAAELLGKAAGRIRMEYYDYRRYRISGQADETPVPVYAMEKAARLISLTLHFIERHLPASGAKTSTKNDKTRE
jgi:CelD/BcsL family acetyltransferase involved in cellulose biosynthesis